MYDFWDYCNAVRRNVLATTLFIAVVRVNETKFLSNLTLSSFSAGLDFGWGGDVCKRGGWKCMCGCWRFLVVRLCCKPGFRGGPGGNRRAGGGPPPPWKADREHNRPKLLHLHRSPPNTCYARGNSGSSPLPFEISSSCPWALILTNRHLQPTCPTCGCGSRRSPCGADPGSPARMWQGIKHSLSMRRYAFWIPRMVCCIPEGAPNLQNLCVCDLVT